ncbi:lasso peptide biosynthesis B2 protein [Paramagnetospirillum magneticum]|uniref:lasso peptide biosynthesis B2 protein n=1 Tax=Paramagnetospirillum magneticum TaxID=84159 RepID=UPI0002F5BD3C|nr:lasso peptide biosynthesis B2 protein [Paramagnetospirillum magneticum]
MPIPEAVKSRLRKLPGYALARSCYGIIRYPEERGIALARYGGKRTIFQPYGTTFPDRYPKIFSFVRDRVGDGADIRILSFGCSTGEEVFSLKSWFPAARIRGLDVNSYNVRTCRRRWRRDGRDPRLSFDVADSTAREASESYDAIFAMAIFRHGRLSDDSRRCDPEIRFADFERSVADLARCLKPGGVLVIRYANFRFSDTAVAADFETMQTFPDGPVSPFYGRDNSRLADGSGDDGVFRKKSGAGATRSSDQPRPVDGRRWSSLPLLMEAGLALAGARLLTVLPFRIAVRWAGLHHHAVSPRDLGLVSRMPSVPEAAAIGQAIRRIARRAPFRAVCLQQALAAAIMLRRRRLPVELHFSVGRDGAGLRAHARSLSNQTVVTGAESGCDHQPIAIFSAPGANLDRR